MRWNLQHRDSALSILVEPRLTARAGEVRRSDTRRGAGTTCDGGRQRPRDGQHVEGQLPGTQRRRGRRAVDVATY